MWGGPELVNMVRTKLLLNRSLTSNQVEKKDDGKIRQIAQEYQQVYGTRSCQKNVGDE